MDKRPSPAQPGAKTQYLRVPEVRYRLRRRKPTGSVTLESKYLRMSEGPRSHPEQLSKKQHQSEEPSRSPPQTSIQTTASSGKTPPSGSPSPSTLKAPEQREDVVQPSFSQLQAPSSSPVAAPFVVPPRSPRLSPRPSPRVTRKAESETATATLPAGSATVQAPNVGGKRPSGEESPTIILTQPPSQKEAATSKKTAADVPVSVLSDPTQQKEPTTKHELQKPDPFKQQVSTTQRAPSPSSDKGTKAGVQFTTPKRDVAHVMEFFQEQEKSLQESFLSMPKGKPAVKKQRTPSPRVALTAASMGLEHLDNLIKLMEQLTSLKDENSKLRKRCDYLESTKVLLQAKQDLSMDSSSSSSGLITLHPEKHRHSPRPGRSGSSRSDGGHHSPRMSSAPGSYSPKSPSLRPRPRLSSAGECDYLEATESASDQRPKRSKSVLHKRSFSTGSLEIPSDLMDEAMGMEGRKRRKSKSGRSIFGSKHSSSKQKSKSSKWARVKKVLTGQKLYEDLGTTIRSLRELGKSSQVRYSTSGLPSGHHDAERRAAFEHRYSVKEIGVRGPLSLGPDVTDTLVKGAHEDLTSDIWMGPPDWWEDYEATKDGGGTSTNSDVSSVIEVTTMYLGKKETTTATSITTTTTITTSPSSLFSSPMTTSVTSASSMSSSGVATSSSSGPERYLSVETSLPRRQSSPSLSAKEGTTEEEEDLLEELTLVTNSTKLLHKSSSCKSADLELPKEMSTSPKDTRESKKFHRTAWGRVKDIIHTRKDSIKKKPKREKSSGFDSEETSEVDIEGVSEDQWRSDAFAEGLLSRSTPKTSPIVARQGGKDGESGKKSMPGGGNVDMAALLAGSVTDEFTRKMQEWEEKRARKTRMVRASMDDSDMGSLEVSSTSQDYVRTVDLRDIRGKLPDSTSEATQDESNTSMEVCGAPSINVEEMQKRMTDSFSRKMMEWERLKYKSSPAGSSMRESSPEIERKGSKGRKDERQKSKRSREEKEKEKWERQRERDKQKVEREQMKLEKEKLRIDKERLRALEREAKLEKLKGRLSQSEMDPSYRNPVLSPLAEYKVTSDFARKLHEWELMKGLSHDVSNSIYLEAQKMNIEHLRETGQQLDTLSKHEQARLSLEGGVREDVHQGPRPGKADPPPPLTLQAYWDSTEDSSPVERESEVSLGDEDATVTSITEEILTKTNIASMERANTQLLTELQRKELEYAAVQEEVVNVNEKLAKVREEHAREMERFNLELAQGSLVNPVKLEVGELESTMGQLEGKIKLMENFGEELAQSMESAAVGKAQSVDGEEIVHAQLVELVEKMRNMLVQASQLEKQSEKSLALSNFETLYSQAMKLQVQMNNLRLSHLERNREIMMIKRQLLLQEVNNLLLQADISRRETELYQFQEAQRFASLKRWKTFGGTDRQRPQAQVELPAARSPTRKDPSEKAIDPRANIPFISEDGIRPSAAGSSFSAPTSPGITAGGVSMVNASQSHSSSPAAPREYSTDHMESHLLTPPSSRGRGQWRVRHSVPAGRGRGGGGGVARLTPRATIQLPASQAAMSTLRVQMPHSLTPSPYSSHSASPLSSPAMDTTPTSPTFPGDSLDLTLTETESSVSDPSSKTDNRPPSQTYKPDFVSLLSDSAPLHKQIEELKRVKSKVDTGSPTLTERAEGQQKPSPAPSPGRASEKGNYKETPDQSIPKQRSLEKPKLTKAATIIDDDYFPAPTVMECTDTVSVEHIPIAQESAELKSSAAGGIDLLPPVADMRQLPPTSDQSRSGSRSPRSPVSKQKILRRQREERETKLKDYKAISPKGSPIAARGKPPLPRQTTPVRQSPSASPATEKGGPRSKSVGDMEPGVPDSPSSRTIQDAINKFEKRATVCETEDRPIDLRKTPSPTLHLPRVGLVSRVKRLKPAAELLEESQRYRSGQSIYATRILQRYMQREEMPTSDPSSSTNKENVSGTYVKSIVQRLSRETTPIRSGGSSRTNSTASLPRTGTPPRTQSELVAAITKQLSTCSSEQDYSKSGTAPLKELTNEGQVKQLKQTFNGSPDRTLSESDLDTSKELPGAHPSKVQNRKSCEVAMILASPESPTEATYQFASTSGVSDQGPPEEDAGANNHKSLPILSASEQAKELQRERAATYSAIEEPPEEMKKPPTSKKDDSSRRGKSKEKSRWKSRERKGDAGRLLSSSLSPDRYGARSRKLGTVGILCQQSMSFDLGVSQYKHKEESTSRGAPSEFSKPRKPRSWDPSEAARAEAVAARVVAAGQYSSIEDPPSSPGPSSSSQGATAREGRPLSTSSEGEVAASSPASGEKKKSRRFLDSSWLQKSKRFFKVSK